MLSKTKERVSLLGVIALVVVLSIKAWGKESMSELTSPAARGGFLLIRHGEAGHNVKGIFNSQIGHPAYTVEHLTEKGREQAKATAETLQEQGVSADNVCRVLISPMPRTQETAAIICHILNIPESKKVILDDLIESGVGDREGYSVTDFDEPDFWFPENPEAFGGETRKQITERVTRALKNDDESCDLSQQYIVVVSHGVPVYLMLEVLGEIGRKLPPAGFQIIHNPVFP